MQITSLRGWVLTEPARLTPAGGVAEAASVRIDSAQKTRPQAEYDADAALPCPDIEIGLRHPVSASWQAAAWSNVIWFTIGKKIEAWE